MMCKDVVNPDRPQRKCGACALRDGYLRLQTHTQNKYLILTAFHCKNAYTNAPQYYIIPTLRVKLKFH